MPYTSYNAYIVQSNGAVVLTIVVLNYLIFSFNIKPLIYIFGATFVKMLETILSFFCFYNIWSVYKEAINPYLAKVKVPFGEHLFRAGPLVLNLWKTLQFLINESLLGKKPLNNDTPTAAPKEVKQKQLFLDFLNFPKEKSDTQPNGSAIVPSFIPTNTASSISEPNRTGIFESKVLSFDISPQTAAGSNLSSLSTSVTPRSGLFSSAVPKLRFTPCIKPPLRPSAHRERIMWYMNRTEEVVDDFRIEQIIEIQKNWNRFNDRLSSLYYDKMILVLFEKIFQPLSKSIETFDAILATRNQSLVKSPSSTIALSLVIPGFNSNCAFTVAEVVEFLTLEGRSNEEGMRYVKDRILELSRSNKLAAYRYTSKTAGMPSDSEIILHVLRVYLSIKEPMAIPPLVPSPVNFFKFLLIYIHITPELDHWKIFDSKL